MLCIYVGEVKGLKGLCDDHGKDRLKIFDCDLFDYQTILEALKGCSALFYNFQLPHDQPEYDVSSIYTNIVIY